MVVVDCRFGGDASFGRVEGQSSLLRSVGAKEGRLKSVAGEEGRLKKRQRSEESDLLYVGQLVSL